MLERKKILKDKREERQRKGKTTDKQ